MKLKNVIPKMDEMFGRLEYAGKGEEITGYVNGRRRVIGNQYYLYSEKQPADNVEVILPANVGKKAFGYEDEIVLMNPRLEVEARRIGNFGHANYILYADDMVSSQNLKK